MPFRTHGETGDHRTSISFTRNLDFNTADGLKVNILENEKRIMKNLNDRLASYLKNVHAMETKNAELERKIKEWYLSHSVVSKDHSDFLSTIKQLQNQVVNTAKGIGKTVLMIESTKLAIEDFRQMYENEAALCLRAEADVNHVRNTLDEITLQGTNLEMEYESLKEDRIILEKNYKEDLALKRDQPDQTVQVNMSVDSACTTDLSSALQNIREYYETVVAKNEKDLEVWYKNKTLSKEQEVSTQSEDPEFMRKELKELKSTYQRMQIELQTICSMMTICETNVSNTKDRYSEQLAKLQRTITDLEFKLQQIIMEMTKKKEESDSLEAEIKEYKILLKGKSCEPQIIYKTVEETVVSKVLVESIKAETTD